MVILFFVVAKESSEHTLQMDQLPKELIHVNPAAGAQIDDNMC